MKLKLNAYTKLIIIISFVISVGLVLFIALNANTHLLNMSENNSRLYSAYRISELMKSFKGNFSVLENKRKAYLLTGDPKFLEEFKLKETETKSYLKSMEKYFSGKPEEGKFDLLKDLTYKKMMEAKNLNQRNNLAGFKGKETSEGSSNTLEEINTVIEEIDKSLSKTTEQLIDNSVEYVRESKKWSVLEVLLGVFVSFAALVLLLRDITVRNKLEAELRVAKKQAENNATMKEQFMANMSHEIRTPMNAILGFTDLIQKTKLDNEQLEYTTAIKSSGANLLNIINDILDFSKIEAGKLSIEKISFYFTGLVDSLRIMFTEKAKQKNISFEVEIDSRMPEFIFGDPTRLTQILVNLINNAIKFTEKGLVKLSCEVKSIEHDIVQLVFRIKDTGIGIPSDKIDSVFERFNQGNKETTRKYGGTGLGLSIVKDLVELQNGEIRVKSKQGSGSEFIVTISYPISYETEKSRTETNARSFPAISDKPLLILLAEDNVLNQKLAAIFLKDMGMKVEIAENGLVAVDKLREKKFDLVLMDIQMPLLDGYHAAQRIRKELKQNIPIIAMTAHIMESEKEKCISYGMNDYLSKPFKEMELYDMLSKYLKPDDSMATNEKEKSENPGAKNGVVDFNDVNDMARGNKAFIIEMIDLFLEKNPSDISELETAIDKKEFGAVRAIAHRMKTSVGFMGLKHLVQYLGEMELEAEGAKDLTRIEAAFNKVKSDCELAVTEFKNALITHYK